MRRKKVDRLYKQKKNTSRGRDPQFSDVVLSINQQELWQIFVDDTASTWYSLLSIRLCIESTHNKKLSENLNVNKVIRLIEKSVKRAVKIKKSPRKKESLCLIWRPRKVEGVGMCIWVEQKYFNGDFAAWDIKISNSLLTHFFAL
jgi:hypothetical protein